MFIYAYTKGKKQKQRRNKMTLTTVQKLSKTRKTLSNQVWGGKYYRGVNNYRTLALVDKYNELKEVAKNEGVWAEYVSLTPHSCVSHDAFDLLA